MLKREYKLKKEKDFNWTFRRSKPVFSGNITLRIAMAENSRRVSDKTDQPRFAFIISAKTEKRSVRRNALRRIYNDIIFELLPRIPKRVNVVLITKRNFDFPYDKELIKSQVLSLFDKSGVFEGRVESNEKPFNRYHRPLPKNPLSR